MSEADLLDSDVVGVVREDEGGSILIVVGRRGMRIEVQETKEMWLGAEEGNYSFHDSFISSTLYTNPSTTPGTFPCNCKRCYTCPYTKGQRMESRGNLLLHSNNLNRVDVETMFPL
eukprot:g37701.t1